MLCILPIVKIGQDRSGGGENVVAIIVRAGIAELAVAAIGPQPAVTASATIGRFPLQVLDVAVVESEIRPAVVRLCEADGSGGEPPEADKLPAWFQLPLLHQCD